MESHEVGQQKLLRLWSSGANKTSQTASPYHETSSVSALALVTMAHLDTAHSLIAANIPHQSHFPAGISYASAWSYGPNPHMS